MLYIDTTPKSGRTEVGIGTILIQTIHVKLGLFWYFKYSILFEFHTINEFWSRNWLFLVPVADKIYQLKL